MFYFKCYQLLLNIYKVKKIEHFILNPRYIFKSLCILFVVYFRTLMQISYTQINYSFALAPTLKTEIEWKLIYSRYFEFYSSTELMSIFKNSSSEQYNVCSGVKSQRSNIFANKALAIRSLLFGHCYAYIFFNKNGRLFGTYFV